MTRRLIPLTLAVALCAGLARSSSSMAQDTAAKMVEVDPLRCWWKTTAGGVRIGETFSVVLTCAVLQNDAVQVQPDETRLGSAGVSMVPFEIVRASHPAD